MNSNEEKIAGTIVTVSAERDSVSQWIIIFSSGILYGLSEINILHRK
jgi:hypothetical protein